MTKSRLDIILSFSLYSFGLLAFICSDLYILQIFSKDMIADWAFTKSTLLIIGSLCLLGYDQVLVRDPSLIRRFYRKFNIQAFCIVIVSVCILSLAKGYGVKEFVFLCIAIILYANTSYLAASYRATFDLWKAQLATNLWRFFLLLTLVVVNLDLVQEYFVIALAASLPILFIGLGVKKLLEFTGHSISLRDKEARQLGYSFVITNITLILAVYGEQFLINLKENAELSSLLFTYFSVFTPIALSLNGFVGFYFAPKLRKENNMSLEKYKKFSALIFIYSLGITMVSVCVGFLYMRYVLEIPLVDIDVLLIVSLSILCIVRGVYTSTSVCLGVFGDTVNLRKSAWWTLLSTIFYIILVLALITLPITRYLVLFISFASVLNWTLRLIISYIYSVQSLKLKCNE